jgi:hypothetical protein
MCLLEHNNDGEFSLTKDFGNDIPQYAILSHVEVGSRLVFISSVERQPCGRGIVVHRCEHTKLAKSLASYYRWLSQAV